jgi:peroxiredoxin
MKMLNHRIVLTVAAVTIAGSVYAGYQLTVDTGAETAIESPAVERPGTMKTATTVLPSKTRSAWDMPKFQLKGLDGVVHGLEDWKGQVIMLNFWASWCATCQYEIKDFVHYQEQYGADGLQILGLGLDEERKLRNVKRTLGINYPVLVMDPIEDLHILTDWGNDKQFIPYTVVINASGEIHYIHRGQMDDLAFNKFVLPLLPGESSK